MEDGSAQTWLRAAADDPNALKSISEQPQELLIAVDGAHRPEFARVLEYTPHDPAGGALQAEPSSLHAMHTT
jgi:hypothetical protein